VDVGINWEEIPIVCISISVLRECLTGFIRNGLRLFGKRFGG